MISKRSPAVGIVVLSMLAISIPSPGLAQHGPGRHRTGADAGPADDATRETTFEGTVADVKSGRSVLNRLVGIHTPRRCRREGCTPCHRASSLKASSALSNAPGPNDVDHDS